jgi:hypothetical protein
MPHQPGHQHTEAFFKTIKNPVKLWLFLLRRLPAAAFSGLRIVAANREGCTVSVPYRWSTTNPFRSTYFACLSMAAELSTGVLAMAQVQGSTPAVSMLVTGLEARFFKKATGITLFTCNEGRSIEASVARAQQTGEAETIAVESIGKNEAGETVAVFSFEWSFKVKRSV